MSLCAITIIIGTMGIKIFDARACIKWTEDHAHFVMSAIIISASLLFPEQVGKYTFLLAQFVKHVSVGFVGMKELQRRLKALKRCLVLS